MLKPPHLNDLKTFFLSLFVSPGLLVHSSTVSSPRIHASSFFVFEKVDIHFLCVELVVGGAC
jgi:hypothetical protein